MRVFFVLLRLLYGESANFNMHRPNRENAAQPKISNNQRAAATQWAVSFVCALCIHNTTVKKDITD